MGMFYQDITTSGEPKLITGAYKLNAGNMTQITK